MAEEQSSQQATDAEPREPLEEMVDTVTKLSTDVFSMGVKSVSLVFDLGMKMAALPLEMTKSLTNAVGQTESSKDKK